MPTASKRRVSLLKLPLDAVDMPGAVAWVRQAIASNPTHTQQVLTLNPEIVVRAQEDEAVRRCIQEAELVTADGIGIVWAAKRLTGVRLNERVTGIDLSLELMRQIQPLSVFFLGSKPGVAERAARESQAKYGIRIAGVQDGYFKDETAVVEAIAQTRPDLLLVGMGERQDTFIHRNKARLGARVAMGVGGTLDVLAGEVERMPEWSQKLKIEWLLRVGLDRKRWGRFPRLIRFVAMVLRERAGDG